MKKCVKFIDGEIWYDIHLIFEEKSLTVLRRSPVTGDWKMVTKYEGNMGNWMPG